MPVSGVEPLIRQLVAERQASSSLAPIETLRVSRYYMRADAFTTEMGEDEIWLRQAVGRFELLD